MTALLTDNYGEKEMGKVQMLKGHTTPPVFCAKLMEVSEEIKHIACVVSYENGESHVVSTTMKNEDIAWLRWVFDQDFRPDDDD